MNSLRRLLRKIHKSKQKALTKNPFKDVRILHSEHKFTNTLVIQLQTTEELDIDALEKLLAELMVTDLVKNNLIQITTTRQGNSSQDIVYRGELTVVKTSEVTTLDEHFLEVDDESQKS